MKVTIRGDSKEIADLIARIQGQPIATSNEAAREFVNNFIQTFAATHGTCLR